MKSLLGQVTKRFERFSQLLWDRRERGRLSRLTAPPNGSVLSLSGTPSRSTRVKIRISPCAFYFIHPRAPARDEP